MARVGGPPAGTPLTQRELEVVIGLSLGGTKGSVAAELGLKWNTVSTHARLARIRTNTRYTGQALAVAVARGEIIIHVEPGEPLEERHQQILVCFANGMSSQEAAETLNVSIHTIKNDITKMYRTLNAVSRAHLVYLGFKTGNLTVNRRKET